MRKKNIVLVVLFAVLLTLFGFRSFANADDTTSTAPTSTIGSITGPADVGSTTVPTETTVFVDECVDLGNGVGQTNIGLQDCIPTTTTVVAVGMPPTTTSLISSNTLPATGGDYMIVFIVLAFGLIVFGVAMMRMVDRSKHQL